MDQRLRLRAGLREHADRREPRRLPARTRATAHSRASTTRAGCTASSAARRCGSATAATAELLRRGDRRRPGLADRSACTSALVPPDGTVVENVDDGGKYRFAGGAPLLVRCDLGAGCAEPGAGRQRHVRARSARTGRRRTMRQYPADGTIVQNIEDGRLLPLRRQRRAPALELRRLRRGAGRQPHAPARGHRAPPSMPHIAAAARRRHLPHRPARAPTGSPAGPRPSSSTDCTPLGGCAGAVTVDAGTIAGLGGGRCWPRPRTARCCADCRPSARGRSSAASGARRSSRVWTRSTSTTARSA